MMTYLKPKKHRILGTREYDFYVPPGDPIGVRHLCPKGVKSAFGVALEIGEQVQVNLQKSSP